MIGEWLYAHAQGVAVGMIPFMVVVVKKMIEHLNWLEEMEDNDNA